MSTVAPARTVPTTDLAARLKIQLLGASRLGSGPRGRALFVPAVALLAALYRRARRSLKAWLPFLPMDMRTLRQALSLGRGALPLAMRAIWFS